MEIKKRFVKNYSVENFDVSRAKKDLFKGKILILQNSNKIFDLVSTIKKIFFEFFKMSVDEFISNNSIDFNETKIVKFQKNIKESNKIRQKFKKILQNLSFDVIDTYCDRITFRFNPSLNQEPTGLLKPATLHRDTWASNFQHQINWWIPLHNVTTDNTIYFVPNYFNRKTKNDTSKWNYELYKEGKKSKSTPVSTYKPKEEEIFSTKLDYGQILIFSGNHLHGSKIGDRRRLNIETRTLCSKDPKHYKLPRNVDNESLLIKRYKWFKSLNNSKFYSD